MRTAGKSSGTYISNILSLRNGVSRSHPNSREMPIAGNIFVVMADLNALSKASVPSCQNHRALADGGHRRAGPSRIVRAMMRTVNSQDGMKPVKAESRRDAERSMREG